MPYCTQADITEQLAASELLALTDDEGIGSIDAAIVTRAIEDADADIDAAIGGRYDLPLATVPPLLRGIAVDLAIYWLFSRRAVTGMPEVRQDRRDIAAKKLAQLATGMLTLDVSCDSGGRAVVVPATRLFTDNTMSGY